MAESEQSGAAACQRLGEALLAGGLRALHSPSRPQNEVACVHIL
jgi:hypothetical protein